MAGIPRPPRPLVPRSEIEKRLSERIQDGRRILRRKILSASSLEEAKRRFRKWDEFNRDLLHKLFEGTDVGDEYWTYFRSSRPRGFVNPTLDSQVYVFKEDVQDKLTYLESLVQRLELMDEPDQQRIVAQEELPPRTKRIFVVHGHDLAARLAVEKVLKSLGLKPVILMDEPNQGRTLIEKVEDTSDVSFAVIILTPDDVGRACRDSDESLRPRARQNVILELGYLMRHLGRSRLCVLHHPAVEIPTDIQGLGYTELDPGGAWQVRLAQELRAAGYDIDMNRLLL